ncbi:MAG TPA: LysM peptidoglycan-binding domain-containing protein [Candidatus Saccharimonadales bacterium]|nr:LysM peptidoglycan-binding domain-containing protein [Candidatus Saccharimonadales bacterium]
MSTTSQSVLAKLHVAQRPGRLARKVHTRLTSLTGNRRFVRYCLVSLNVLLLAAIGLFVLHDTKPNQILDRRVTAAAASSSDVASTPLDQLSSADIAVNAAIATQLPETTAVANQAQSVAAQLTVAPADSTVVAKPQSVATKFVSNKDIKTYVAQDGDTIASIAAQFNVTSDSIRWSNNLSASTVTAGTKLVIPPMTGIVYTVKAGDTVDSLAQKYKANKDQLVLFNDAEINGISTGEQIIIPNGQQPVAAVSSYYLAGTFTALYGGNGYDYGFCTWYVATQIAVPSNWGNASSWAYYAALSGWTVSSTPVVGAIAQTPYAAGGLGHVAIVDAVSDDGTQIKIRDMNGIAGFARVGYSDWISTSTYPHYIYH